MKKINLEIEDAKAAINYNSLLQYYGMEIQKNQQTFNIIKNQYQQLTDKFFEKYGFDKDMEFRFADNMMAIEIFKKEKEEDKNDK